MRVMIKRTELYDLAVELQEISNNLEKRLCSCDPRIDSLYIKYGVND